MTVVRSKRSAGICPYPARRSGMLSGPALRSSFASAECSRVRRASVCADADLQGFAILVRRYAARWRKNRMSLDCGILNARFKLGSVSLTQYGPQADTKPWGVGPINMTHLTLRSALWRPAAGWPKAPPNPTIRASEVEAPDSRGQICNRSSESLCSGLRGRSSCHRCSETEP